MAKAAKKPPRIDWRTRAYAAAHGRLTGAIIRAAAFDDSPDMLPPKFVGKACITSDGYIVCDYVDRAGQFHHGALVGVVNDLTENIRGLADHIGLNDQERKELYAAIRAWVGIDYRHGNGAVSLNFEE